MTLTRRKELGRGSKELKRTELKPVSARRRTQLAEAGVSELFSTLHPSSTVGLARATALKAKPKADKPVREKLPLPIGPGRERPTPKLAAAKTPKRPKDTGPNSTLRTWVWERLGRVCVVPGCGREATQLHHRMNRGMGGDRRWFINHPANLVPTCHVCNGEVEQKRGRYEALGMFLEEGSWPYEQPVNLAGLGWMVWDLDAADWISVHDFNDFLTIDRAGVTV